MDPTSPDALDALDALCTSVDVTSMSILGDPRVDLAHPRGFRGTPEFELEVVTAGVLTLHLQVEGVHLSVNLSQRGERRLRVHLTKPGRRRFAPT